jgi:hypothetical protein
METSVSPLGQDCRCAARRHRSPYDWHRTIELAHVGPMKAAALFARELLNRRDNAPVRILIELFGSLARTGKGRSTDVAASRD